MPSFQTRFVFIVGTTGSGKSDLALQLAKQNKGAIVNADSIQMYTQLNIGSAKPTQDERAQVPHFLFDLVEAPDVVTVGEFHREFYKNLPELLKFPYVFVVGGTGFYLQALEKGLPKIPQARSDFQAPLFEKWKKDPESQVKDHKRLQSLDPVAAKKIHANDQYRLARALDIMQATGKTVTQVWEEHENSESRFQFPILKLGFQSSRQVLQPRLEKRTERMLKQGWIQEVKQLLDQGLKDWDPLLSVGYSQVRDYLLQGKSDQTELIQLVVKATLHLAKKQRTWFGRDLETHWVDKLNEDGLSENSFENSLAKSENILANWKG